MHKIKDILRLYLLGGVTSCRRIGRAVGCGKTAVSQCLQRAAAAGLTTWEAVAALDEEALEAYEGYLEARPDSADREHVAGRIDVLRAAIEARRRAEMDAEIEARKAALEAAARVKAERPLTQYVGPGPGPWITIGIGSATVVAGAVLFGLGQRDQSAVESAPPGSSYSTVQEEAERGPKRTKAGIALLSVGGAAVVGGLIWQLTGGHEEAMPELSIGPTGISLRGRF